jgi:hypothetical protein
MDSTPNSSWLAHVDLWVALEYPTMKLDSFTAIISALTEAQVRFIVAGGLAVNAHGYLRFTKDVDLVVQLIPDNIQRAFAALIAIGYQPSVPIVATQFADPTTRMGWVRDKHMQVLQFWSDRHPETPIDVFVSEPFSFDEEYSRALTKPLLTSMHVRFVSLPTLIAMKAAAGRPQDLIDIEHLKMMPPNDRI